ncbi:hemerythrin domain-containing protein [Streptomyces sp. NPDC020951]|uniref:hemerythrin domain-containing protein n=1 Tax=Streptomyces sp. NPDC020951 TaxID=3365104 RepID=UPI003799FA41
MGQGDGGNVIDELVTDHREVEELFGRIEALPPGADDRRLYADRATMELVRQSMTEEQYLHPSVRERVPGGDVLADDELDRHARAERIMKDLEGREADDPEFDRLVGMLMREVRTHLADEERNLFPRLRAECPTVILDGLGDKVRKARKTAPTRPHPSAPDEPPADETLAPGVGLVDRMRDAMTGPGKPY